MGEGRFMIRIAVVDDEAAFLLVLKKKIDKLFEKQGCEFQSFIFTDARLMFEHHCHDEFQLVFLDIDMPEINGFNIASKIRVNQSDTEIIFVSNHSNYVFETFQYKPFRFIRKEKLDAELPEAIKSYCAELNKNREYVTFELDNKMIVSEKISKIVYFFSIRHDIFFITRSKETKTLSSRIYTMEKIEEMLRIYGFLRIHKSYLVNYRFVYQFRENSVLLTMEKNSENEILPVSHRRLSNMKKQYQSFVQGGDDV